jgi:hypothetical protein
MSSLQNYQLTITNPKICDYYKNHPSLNFEDLNMKLLEMLEMYESYHGTISNPVSTSIHSFSPPTQNKQFNELKQTFSDLKDYFGLLTQSIMLKLMALKTEYILELKTIIMEPQPSTRFIDYNNQYTQKCWNMIITCIPEHVLKQKLPQIHDKIQGLLKQYAKMIQSNMDTILKTHCLDTILPDYITNYETNTSHLFQSINQIFADYIVSKDETIQKILSSVSVSSNASSQIMRLNYEIFDVLQSLQSSSLTNTTQQQFETLLSQLYPTSSISLYLQNEDLCNHGYTILRPDNKPTVYIQSMQYKDRNINLEETKQFIKTIQSLNVNGVFISQHTGITSKPNYHIDIINNKVVVFLHQVNYVPEKIQMAIETIDHIHSKLCEFNLSNDNKYSIPKDILESINREYQSFIQQKENIISFVKDTNRKLMSQLDEFAFPQLDSYLLTKYSSCKKQGYTCELCNQFTVGTLKGLAAHKRGCNRKIGLAPTSVNTCSVSKTTSASIEI